jgi:hypothetical protein
MELLEAIVERAEVIDAAEPANPSCADAAKVAAMFQALCEKLEVSHERIARLERQMKKLVSLRDGLLD